MEPKCSQLAVNNEYIFQGIMEQLKMAAEAFLEGDDGCEIIMEKKEVRLSKILQWYKEDFGNNQTEVVHKLIESSNSVGSRLINL